MKPSDRTPLPDEPDREEEISREGPMAPAEPGAAPAGPPPKPPTAPGPQPSPYKAGAGDAESGWGRPRPVRQDTNVRAWSIFLAVVCLIAALWVPVRTMYQRTVFKPTVEGPRDADSFIALAYGGVSGVKNPGTEEVPRRVFEQQIRALRERGFNPIGLSDVKAFYERGELLPRKAVLISMEQGKRISYLETREILRAARWKAVMFIRADVIQSKDPGSLRWPILRDMARSGAWEVGAESVEGFRRIPTGPEGETGNFFASPRWISGENRLETPDEFTARVQADHVQMLADFKAGMDAEPQAFAFPYGDYGQFDPRAVSTRVMNIAQVGRHYGIGFTLGPFLLNTRNTNPRTLNRLLVNPNWSLDQFISIVESGWSQDPWKIARPMDAMQWQADWGRIEHPKDGHLWLKAIRSQAGPQAYPPTTGALAWMISSDLFQDFTVRMRFRVVQGQFGVRLRANPGGERGVRVIFDRHGGCWVYQKVYGSEEFLQTSTQSLSNGHDDFRDLEITLRGRSLFVLLNGRMILREPLDLLGEPQPGMLGIEVWDPEIGSAATEISSIEFPRPMSVLKYWMPEASTHAAALIGELDRESSRLAAVSPPWMEAFQSVPLVLPQWKDDSIRTFARIRGIPILPLLGVRSPQVAAQIPPELILKDATRMGFDGVTIDCRRTDVNDIQPMVEWMKLIFEQTKEHHMKMAILFPDALTRLASFASIAALFPGALFAVEPPERAAQLEDKTPGIVRTEEARIPPAADMHLDLYYQLATRSLPTEEMSPQARQDVLRRSGYLAFQEGEYDRAIRSWEDWLKEDPGSSEALSLIGRAYVQKNDLPTALDYYTRSLEISPGQINLGIRRAELLEKMGRGEDAREQLNLYARIFPENPDILIAQSQWLERRKRRAEARTLVEKLVRQMPLNLDARLALLNLHEQPAERYQAMRDILALGDSTEAVLPFGYSLLGMEMLTYPESPVFFDFIRRLARTGPPSRQRELYENFLPMERSVVDDFSAGTLSDGWIASGSMRAMEEGRYDLRAAIDQTEAYLRLKRSELLRDAFLEVTLDESQGLFWIYARRSVNGMVRFGFDQEGFIYLQVWHKGEMVAQSSRPWIRPPGSLRMRLEIRGDGARGYINGMEIFNSALGIPAPVAYGWWGVAPFAFDMGVARAKISRLECGPLPSTVILLPPGAAQEQAGQLRPYVGRASAIAPAWFFQRPDGSLPDSIPPDIEVLRLFSAFHNIRLLPVVDLSYDSNVDPAQVVNLIQRFNLSGVVLKHRLPPPAEWIQSMVAALEHHPADVILLETKAALWDTPGAEEAGRGEELARPRVAGDRLPKPGDLLPVRELPLDSVLFPPLQESWTLPLYHAETPVPAEGLGPAYRPRIYILDKKGGGLPMDPS